METEKMISVVEFCQHYHAEPSFITSLQEFDLIEITTIEDAAFINPEQIQQLEKLIRLHYDLDVNLEGLDVVQHLLQRIETMQQELTTLKNRLSGYENE
jgi:hypothetical protein